MAVHKIGGQSFAYMFGNVPAIKDEIELIQKPGEDGHIRRRLGRRSPLFELRAQNIFATQVVARNAFDAYVDMIVGPGTDLAWGLIKDDVNYSSGNNPYLVSVMGVKLNELQKKSVIAGYSGKWFMEVVFNLVLVPGVVE